MQRKDAPDLAGGRIDVDHVDLEGDIGGHGDAHRAVGLDRHVAQDLAHVVAGRRRRRVVLIEIERQLPGGGLGRWDRDRLHDPQEARRALIGRGLRHAGDAARRGDIAALAVLAIAGRAVPVVDAADVDDAVRRRSCCCSCRRCRPAGLAAAAARRCRSTNTPSVGVVERQEGVAGRIEHPGAVEHRRGGRAWCRRRLALVQGRMVPVGVLQPALAPGHQDAPAAVPERERRGEAAARGDHRQVASVVSTGVSTSFSRGRLLGDAWWSSSRRCWACPGWPGCSRRSAAR